MKAIVVTDPAAGTAGMTLTERPEPPAAINDVVVRGSCVGMGLDRARVAVDLDRPRQPGPDTVDPWA